MSHYTGWVVSVGEGLEEPWMPDEETYNEYVKCDYCNRIDWKSPKKMAEYFLKEFSYFKIPGRQPSCKIVKGTAVVTIPKGFIGKAVRSDLNLIKDLIGKATPKDLVHWSHDLHRAYKLLDFCNPFGTVVVELSDDGNEDYDTFTRWVWGLYDDNRKRDTYVFLYGAMDHHA